MAEGDVKTCDRTACMGQGQRENVGVDQRKTKNKERTDDG